MVEKTFDSIPNIITTTESRGFCYYTLIIKTVNGCNIDQNQGWTLKRQTLTKESQIKLKKKLSDFIKLYIDCDHHKSLMVKI